MVWVVCAVGCAPAAGGADRCPGAPITTSVTAPVAFDVRAGEVSIAVTLRGQPLPDTSMPSVPRGTLVFRDDARGSEALIRFDGTGPSRARTLLGVGRYDVLWRPPSAECAVLAGMPCVGGVLARGVEVRAGAQELAFDLQPIRLRVNTTVNGAAPDARFVGSVVLACEGSDGLILGGSIPTPATVEIPALAGQCRALFRTLSCLPDGTAPCIDGVVREGIEVRSDTREIALDVRSARVSVTVDHDGAAMPDAMRSRGAIHLSDGAQTATQPIGPTGPATAVFRVIAGTYDAWWTGECDGFNERVVCGRRTIARQRVIDRDASLGLSMHPVVVRGTLSVNGAPVMVARDEVTPSVEFRMDATDRARALWLDRSSGAQYFVVLDRGSYTPWFAPEPACERAASERYGCVAAPIGAAQRIESAANLPVDYRATRRRFDVTLDGAPLDARWTELVLDRVEGGERSVLRAPAGAVFEALVPEAIYDLRWRPNPESSAAPMRPARLPQLGALVRRGVALRADESEPVPVALRSIDYRGALTVNGALVPASNQGVVQVRYAREFDGRAALGNRAPGVFDLALHEGTYVLQYVPEQGACAASSATPSLCSSEYLFGCR